MLFFIIQISDQCIDLHLPQIDRTVAAHVKMTCLLYRYPQRHLSIKGHDGDDVGIKGHLKLKLFEF